MPKYAIYYRKDPSFSLDEHLNVQDVFMQRTHALVLPAVEAKHIDHVFQMMQGEFWSPNGQAHELIENLDLKHTSMSVGDVVLDLETGIFHQADMAGWKVVSQIPWDSYNKWGKADLTRVFGDS